MSCCALLLLASRCYYRWWIWSGLLLVIVLLFERVGSLLLPLQVDAAWVAAVHRPTPPATTRPQLHTSSSLLRTNQQSRRPFRRSASTTIYSDSSRVLFYSADASKNWYLRDVADVLTDDDELNKERLGQVDSARFAQIERQAVGVVADLIRKQLAQQQQQQDPRQLAPSLLFMTNETEDDKKDDNDDGSSPEACNPQYRQLRALVRGRFLDLATTRTGEQVLENLFLSQWPMLVSLVQPNLNNNNNSHHNHLYHVIRAAVMVVQSLCIMGSQTGVTGTPEQLRRMVAHLEMTTDDDDDDDDDDEEGEEERSRAMTRRDRSEVLVKRSRAGSDRGDDVVNPGSDTWDRDHVRQLKYLLDRTPAIPLLTQLKWKRTSQGAFDLLVALGAWTKHENLPLLRSGFPIRFSPAEMEAAQESALSTPTDLDGLLGIRQDLRHFKVYTIDGASTSEIDDGLSVEVIGKDPEGKDRHRIWVHIADADHWVPRRSKLFEIARQRITSLYLPTGSISMLPPEVSVDRMSLHAHRDSYALSLGVELNDDGSVNPSTIMVTPSLIHVMYRLTYDQVDEMLEEGTGYHEEWALGVLLDAATKRRNFRIRNGSMEGMVPKPIPSSSTQVLPDINASDGIGITLSQQISHNAGQNRTNAVQADPADSLQACVSSAYLLVTEAMILAGESLGHWKKKCDADNRIDPAFVAWPNHLRLAFRTQPKPDFTSRAREKRVMMNLIEYNVGDGYCHAWYARRFVQPVRITEDHLPHAGLGLTGYVQWTSPIRRFGDLQVHASIKRYLRRCRSYELARNNLSIPAQIAAQDLGLPADAMDRDGRLKQGSFGKESLDTDIDYLDGIGLVGAARVVQRQSQQYWIFEYIRRLISSSPKVLFTGLVLGCIDPEKRQFAIYVYELGLEHRYTAPGTGRLEPGTKLRLRVDHVSPRHGLLSFVREL